jgi:hypothetical protein
VIKHLQLGDLPKTLLSIGDKVTGLRASCAFLYLGLTSQEVVTPPSGRVEHKEDHGSAASIGNARKIKNIANFSTKSFPVFRSYGSSSLCMLIASVSSFENQFPKTFFSICTYVPWRQWWCGRYSRPCAISSAFAPSS